MPTGTTVEKLILSKYAFIAFQNFIFDSQFRIFVHRKAQAILPQKLKMHAKKKLHLSEYEITENISFVSMR